MRWRQDSSMEKIRYANCIQVERAFLEFPELTKQTGRSSESTMVHERMLRSINQAWGCDLGAKGWPANRLSQTDEAGHRPGLDASSRGFWPSCPTACTSTSTGRFAKVPFVTPTGHISMHKLWSVSVSLTGTIYEKPLGSVQQGCGSLPRDNSSFLGNWHLDEHLLENNKHLRH